MMKKGKEEGKGSWRLIKHSTPSLYVGNFKEGVFVNGTLNGKKYNASSSYDSDKSKEATIEYGGAITRPTTYGNYY